jgi:hypothetical protein
VNTSMKRKRMQNARQLLQILALQWLLVGLAALSSTFAAILGLVPFFVVERNESQLLQFIEGTDACHVYLVFMDSDEVNCNDSDHQSFHVSREITEADLIAIQGWDDHGLFKGDPDAYWRLNRGCDKMLL